MLTRREALAGAAATAAVAILPAASVVAYRTIYLTGPIYRAYEPAFFLTRHLIVNARWQYDDANYASPLIRHVPTGLVYVALGDDLDDAHAVEQLSPRQCNPQPILQGDPFCLTGYAARIVAIHAALLLRSRRVRHAGAIFLDYHESDRRERFRAPTTTDAPPIIVLFDDAVTSRDV
jgi:hypothetical protein